MHHQESPPISEMNSNDSRRGALAAPVISRSIATKSEARTWWRSLVSEASKLVLVTVLRRKGDADCGGPYGGSIDDKDEEQRTHDRTCDSAKD